MTKIRLIKLRVIAIIFVITASFCYSITSKVQSITTLDLIVNYPIPIISPQGDLYQHNLRDTIHIFYYGDYVVYQLSPVRQLEDDSQIPGSRPYFVYCKSDDSGHVYTPSMKDSVTVNVDTLLKYYGFANADFAPSILDTLCEKKETSGITVEKYYLRQKVEGWPYDSTYYYFSSRLNTKYSIARAQDSLHRNEGKKVFKVRLISNLKYNEQFKMVIPRQEMFFEIQQVTAANPELILNLVEAYKEKRLKKTV